MPFRRKITVFSAALAAFTIDHSEKESAGPDLLLSFHDNDHYNSVRVKDAQKITDSSQKLKATKRNKSSLDIKRGKPEEKHHSASEEEMLDATENTTASMSELSVNDSKLEPEREQQEKPKKKSLCPCGSGLRYRKCCLAAEKHAGRVEKLRGISAAEERKGKISREGTEEEEPSMKGNFRVLEI